MDNIQYSNLINSRQRDEQKIKIFDKIRIHLLAESMIKLGMIRQKKREIESRKPPTLFYSVRSVSFDRQIKCKIIVRKS